MSACTPAPTSESPPPPSGPATSTTTSPPTTDQESHEHLSGSASATERLEPARRAALGLPPETATPQLGAQLGPLTPAQWADPEAVAARFLLVDTNYPATEDPAAVWARRATYTTARLAEDLRASSSAAAGLADLTRKGAVFQGEVIGLATITRDDTTAVVGASMRRTTAVPGAAPLRSRVVFYRLTLVHDDARRRWLVVDVELS